MPARVKAKQRERKQYCSLTIFGTSSEWRHSNRTSRQLILKSRRSHDENLLTVALWYEQKDRSRRGPRRALRAVGWRCPRLRAKDYRDTTSQKPWPNAGEDECAPLPRGILILLDGAGSPSDTHDIFYPTIAV